MMDPLGCLVEIDVGHGSFDYGPCVSVTQKNNKQKRRLTQSKFRLLQRLTLKATRETSGNNSAAGVFPCVHFYSLVSQNT